jgi:hypothetical protein
MPYGPPWLSRSTRQPRTSLPGTYSRNRREGLVLRRVAANARSNGGDFRKDFALKVVATGALMPLASKIARPNAYANLGGTASPARRYRVAALGPWNWNVNGKDWIVAHSRMVARR